MKLLFLQIFGIVLLLAGWCGGGAAQTRPRDKSRATPDVRAEKEIRKLLEELAAARRRGDSSAPERVLGDDFLLTSQSGKLYGKADTLLDFKNPLEQYEDKDFTFRFYGDTAIVNLVNTRKRKSLEAATFRVTQVWLKRFKAWRLVAMQTTLIK
jgi:hypothetical protein